MQMIGIEEIRERLFGMVARMIDNRYHGDDQLTWSHIRACRGVGRIPLESVQSTGFYPLADWPWLTESERLPVDHHRGNPAPMSTTANATTGANHRPRHRRLPPSPTTNAHHWWPDQTIFDRSLGWLHSVYWFIRNSFDRFVSLDYSCWSVDWPVDSSTVITIDQDLQCPVCGYVDAHLLLLSSFKACNVM